MSPNEGQPSSNSHGDPPNGTSGKHPAGHKPAGPDDYDFSPKPLPDGRRLAGVVGIVMDDTSNGSRNPVVPSHKGTIPGITPGPQLHRNPLQVPMAPPPFPKATGRHKRRFAQDAEVNQAMKDMTAGLAGDTFAQIDTGYTPTGRRMVVVDESFYLDTRPHNHRPKPIREGAGKGPRKFNHSPRIRC